MGAFSKVPLIFNLKIKFNSTAGKSAVEGKKMVNPLIPLRVAADDARSARGSSEDAVGRRRGVIRRAVGQSDRPDLGRA